MKTLVIITTWLACAIHLWTHQSGSTTGRTGKKTLIITTLLATLIMTVNNGCKKTTEIPNLVPTCKITSPYKGYITEQGALITILADANDKDGQISEINFLTDGISLGSLTSLPYNFVWDTHIVDTGYHTISAIAKDNLGSTVSDEITIYLTETGNILAHPVAAFSANETAIFSGSSVQFTDLTTNLPNSWFWDFGDGNTSTLQNPVHAYSVAGQYTVILLASNQYGNDTEEKEQFITVTTIELETGTVTDYDGNTYKTVKIGNQWWMAENLKTTHMANGTKIPLVKNNTEWTNLSYTDIAYCYYENSLTNATFYGLLYSWAAAMNGESTSDENPSGIQGICPCEWHLPSDTEWMELEMYLGMSFDEAYGMGWRGTDEGSKLKTTSGWYDGGDGNNISGFSALPGGQRVMGTFNGLSQITLFWTSTEYFHFTYLAFNRTLSYKGTQVGWFMASHFYGYPKNYGFSVRCVKD
ncbi:MAG: hypothetical protein CVT99_15855 [Bacteroidetes bacterium HGW-Bacteroidetes-16]|jgi:uncharacterized protein (TIGR02145 family)|nr:MAG: hypothetical protein CVT99_15855 [Bacteroidetes bacterium HGW-Bacteroidetes-16]